MERITHWVRQSGMMSLRHVHGIVGAGLLCAAVAGCGTEVASTPAAGQVAASVSASSSAPAVGCAAVGEATTVTIRRTSRLVEPAHVGNFTMTQRKPALVRALFGDFCTLVGHPYRGNHPTDCPAAFGLDYSGTFYVAGQRKLATFVYGANGCQTVQITASGKSTFTLVFGPTAATAPQLENDMAAALGQSKSAVFGSGPQVNPGGPMKTATK
jgi:hypothetical protein